MLHYYYVITASFLAAVFEIASDEGIIDIDEGLILFQQLFTSGFSYGAVPIKISTLTYSEYAQRGFSLTDDFDSDDIPTDAADSMCYQY